MDPLQLSIDALHTTTPSRYTQCTQILKADGSPSQLSIDALNTTIPSRYSIMHVYTECRWTPLVNQA